MIYNDITVTAGDYCNCQKKKKNVLKKLGMMPAKDHEIKIAFLLAKNELVSFFNKMKIETTFPIRT